MRLDDALRIPGAYAVALIAADGPALTWWGRSPTDEQARAAAGIGRSAADLVRLGSADTRPDTLDDVLVTSANAFHVLRLLPGADGAGRVAHLMLRRAGANLAMARHDFRRLTAAYVAAERTTSASPVEELSVAVAEPLTPDAPAPVADAPAAGADEQEAPTVRGTGAVSEPALGEPSLDDPLRGERDQDEPVPGEPAVDEHGPGEPVVDEHGPGESVADPGDASALPDVSVPEEPVADEAVSVDGEADEADAPAPEVDVAASAPESSPRHAVDEESDDDPDMAVADFLEPPHVPSQPSAGNSATPESSADRVSGEELLAEVPEPVSSAPEEAGSAEAGPAAGDENVESVDNPGLGLRTDEQGAPGVEPDAPAVEDRQTEPQDKPVLPRREPSTDKIPPAAVTASATPSAWLDLLGQPFLNDEQVLERVLGSLKGL